MFFIADKNARYLQSNAKCQTGVGIIDVNFAIITLIVEIVELRLSADEIYVGENRLREYA